MGPPGDHRRLDRLSSFSGGRDQAALRDPLPWHFLWWIALHTAVAKSIMRAARAMNRQKAFQGAGHGSSTDRDSSFKLMLLIFRRLSEG